MTDYRENGDIFENTKGLEHKSIDTYLNYNDKKPGVFFFYAPWCGHCRKKKKFINALYNTFGRSKKIINVYAFNCEDSKVKEQLEQNKDKLKIEGFPTMKIKTQNTENKDKKMKEYTLNSPEELMIYLVAITNNIPVDKIKKEFEKEFEKN
jgi:thiol-disulfide isomerase/thioredoxin